MSMSSRSFKIKIKFAIPHPEVKVSGLGLKKSIMGILEISWGCFINNTLRRTHVNNILTFDIIIITGVVRDRPAFDQNTTQ